MAGVEADQLKEAVERMHGGTATFAQSVPVRETVEGKMVWGRASGLRLSRASDRDTRLCLVIADRGK
jgi:hypothetical protein